MILSIWLTHLLPIILEVAIRQDQCPTKLPTQQPWRSIWCTYWNDLDLGILINHLFSVLIFRGVTIHKRYVPSYVQEICLPDLFLFANTHKEFSVFYSSRRVTMVLLLLTMVCVLGLYIIPIHMTCWVRNVLQCCHSNIGSGYDFSVALWAQDSAAVSAVQTAAPCVEQF